MTRNGPFTSAQVTRLAIRLTPLRAGLAASLSRLVVQSPRPAQVIFEVPEQRILLLGAEARADRGVALGPALGASELLVRRGGDNRAGQRRTGLHEAAAALRPGSAQAHARWGAAHRLMLGMGRPEHDGLGTAGEHEEGGQHDA